MKCFHFILATSVATCLGLMGCRSAATSVATFHTPNIECMGVEHDGSQTLRSYGTGSNKTDAIEQAKKNAVREVIFKGIRYGQTGCNMRPLVNEVNAEEKYRDYFNIFFADGGEYRKYVSLADERKRSRDKAKAQTFIGYSITVRVLRSELESRLKADHVIE